MPQGVKILPKIRVRICFEGLRFLKQGLDSAQTNWDQSWIEIKRFVGIQLNNEYGRYLRKRYSCAISSSLNHFDSLPAVNGNPK